MHEAIMVVKKHKSFNHMKKSAFNEIDIIFADQQKEGGYPGMVFKAE